VLQLSLSQGCRGISAPTRGAPSPPHPALLSGLLGQFPKLLLSPLIARQRFAVPYPDSPQVPPWQLWGWAVPCGRAVGAGCNWPCPGWGNPGRPSQRLPSSPLPDPGHLQPAHTYIPHISVCRIIW